MDGASSKSRPRKSMRVATIFTGVAACTFGAATQVANAQDAAPTAPTHPATHARLAIADGRSYGSIRMSDGCAEGNVHKTWLHVSVNNSSPYANLIPYRSWCFGYFGLWNSPPGIGIVAQCGGNNHGLLVGVTAAGDKWSATYGPGTKWRTLEEAHLYGVFINSWTGNDECGYGPHAGD